MKTNGLRLSVEQYNWETESQRLLERHRSLSAIGSSKATP
jgi:hypothetical protein